MSWYNINNYYGGYYSDEEDDDDPYPDYDELQETKRRLLKTRRMLLGQLKNDEGKYFDNQYMSREAAQVALRSIEVLEGDFRKYFEEVASHNAKQTVFDNRELQIFLYSENIKVRNRIADLLEHVKRFMPRNDQLELVEAMELVRGWINQHVVFDNGQIRLENNRQLMMGPD